jgi:hypothetical protein
MIISYPLNTPDKWLDFDILPTEAILLSPSQINQAAEYSRQIPEPSRAWQTYLNALALFGFEQWLEQRDSELTLHQEDCSVFQPSVANAIATVCNLKVNDFKLCLIATGSLSDEQITLPRAIVDLPEFVPHFYVLVEIQEEQETAVIAGQLSYQQLQQQLTIGLSPEADWTYQLPLNWFDTEPDSLLLYLRSLEPTAIPLPSHQRDRADVIANMQPELASLLPQLRSRQLWEVLNWEQGTVVLTSPELLNWVYQLQTAAQETSLLRTPDENGNSVPLPTNLKDLLQLLTQPAVNVGRWLWDELDELATELSWTLLPNLTPSPMRSPVEEFEAITTQLQQRGLQIPPQARGAHRDVLVAGIPLRLYAVTWSLVSESDPHGWSLLLVLGAPLEMHLPPGLTLRVSDQTGILVERSLNPASDDSYLFTRVIGSREEKFLVTVSLMEGVDVTLPPFAFYPERSL